MALIGVDTISEALKSRPYYLTQITSEKAVKAAFLDVLEAYIVPAVGMAFNPEEGSQEEEAANRAILHLTYARLLYHDVGKLAYATAKAMKDNTATAGEQDIKRAVAQYRRMGVSRLEELRMLLGLEPPIFAYEPILGETI